MIIMMTTVVMIKSIKILMIIKIIITPRSLFTGDRAENSLQQEHDSRQGRLCPCRRLEIPPYVPLGVPGNGG